MKLKIERSKFLEGLKSVQNIVAGKGSSPILQNVLLEARGEELKMVTTDLDISVKATCECKVEVEGATTLPVKLLFNSIMKVSDGEVEIETDSNERATIKAGSAKFKLAGISEADFPKLPKDEEAYSYNIPQAILREMLRKVAYAASQDDTRRTLKGVLMSITVQKSQVCFNLGSILIYSKLIDETYPNYRQVIPGDTAEHIPVDRQLLLDALERASVMSMDEAHSTKLIFSDGKLTVTSAASDIGEAKDEVPIKYAGQEIEIMFNPSYVMDPLKAIDDDEITINLNNGHSPAVIRCSIPFLYVLMPLRSN